MSFEVDRYSSAWAHVALCADLTWTTEHPDDFVMANQRLWAQHRRLSQIIQDAATESHNFQINNQNESEKRQISNQSHENGSYSDRRSVKDVIPESRLAQFYGNFYYDEVREKCYTNINEKPNGRGYNGQGSDNCDLTECWMLPEVDYWFRKLLDETSDRNSNPRRRRQYRMLPEDDFERWVPTGAQTGEEAALAARVLSVRPLWSEQLVSPGFMDSPTSAPRPPSPLATSRKIRARRRQPRRFATLTPPPPSYYLDAPAHLLCDPTRKFQFEPPRPPQLAECQRAISRLSASVQAVMRASAVRCSFYRGTNVSRYTPTSQRPARYQDRRYGVWWPRDHPTPKLDHRYQLTNFQIKTNDIRQNVPAKNEVVQSDKQEVQEDTDIVSKSETLSSEPQPEQIESEPLKQENVIIDDQMPSTSEASDSGSRKKRLYSTVLSTSAPPPINLASVGCVRLSQKLTPGLLKLNPKIVLPAARIRPPVVDNKFEELEKEALEQYKASDESIDTKFHELEKQAVEQYSTSNSNTSCSSGNSAEKKASNLLVHENESKNSAKFHKHKMVDSVVIYSQNFPDLNKKNTSLKLKNFHIPPRGEIKEPAQRPRSSRSFKFAESQRAASDTDYEARECKGNHKGSMRWTLHVIPPKKRHLTLCVSDFSSDEEIDGASRSIKDARPCVKKHISNKMKMSAHGGGDLHPIMRKT